MVEVVLKVLVGCAEGGGGCVRRARGAGDAGGDALCAASILEAVEGRLCLLDVPEVTRCVLLCMLEAVEGWLCSLDVLEGVRCVLICSSRYLAFIPQRSFRPRLGGSHQTIP